MANRFANIRGPEGIDRNAAARALFRHYVAHQIRTRKFRRNLQNFILSPGKAGALKRPE